MGGGVPQRGWNVCTLVGGSLRPGSDGRKELSLARLFLIANQLAVIVTLTSKQLISIDNPTATAGEILKFFGVLVLITFVGVLVLITRFDFPSQAPLWSRADPSKYEPAFCLGHATTMSKNHFDSIWLTVWFSRQPAERPNHTTSEAHRWMLVDRFADLFNRYRETNFNPSNLICVDESMSCCYGQGGFWINHGLP
jgi:hypothetical protein